MGSYDFRDSQGAKVPPYVEALAKSVISATIEVHRVLGRGLTEPHCQGALSHDLLLGGIPQVRKAQYNVRYKGEPAGTARLDCLIDGELIVELKAVGALTDGNGSQVITYLHLHGMPLAVMVNHSERVLRDGIKRVINAH